MDFKLSDPIDTMSAEEALEEKRRIAFLVDLNKLSLDPATRAAVAAREQALSDQAETLLKETKDAS